MKKMMSKRSMTGPIMKTSPMKVIGGQCCPNFDKAKMMMMGKNKGGSAKC